MFIRDIYQLRDAAPFGVTAIEGLLTVEADLQEALRFVPYCEHADRAIVLKSDSGEAHYQRGAAHRQKRMFREAVADFTEAIRHNPDLVWAYRERAAVYEELGEPALGLKDQLRADEIEAGRKR